MLRNTSMRLALAASWLLFITGPGHAADLCLGIQFQCNGFEPNWQFVTGGGSVSFIDPENPNWETEPLVVPGCVLQGSPNDFEVTTGGPLSLTASIIGQSCTEPNGDLTDFSVTVTFNQGAQTPDPNPVSGTGCCKLLP